MKLYLFEILGLCTALLVFGFLLITNLPNETIDERKAEQARVELSITP